MYALKGLFLTLEEKYVDVGFFPFRFFPLQIAGSSDHPASQPTTDLLPAVGEEESEGRGGGGGGVLPVVVERRRRRARSRGNKGEEKAPLCLGEGQDELLPLSRSDRPGTKRPPPLAPNSQEEKQQWWFIQEGEGGSPLSFLGLLREREEEENRFFPVPFSLEGTSNL